jgi:hypothetical protein
MSNELWFYNESDSEPVAPRYEFLWVFFDSLAEDTDTNSDSAGRGTAFDSWARGWSRVPVTNDGVLCDIMLNVAAGTNYTLWKFVVALSLDHEN